MAHPLKVLVVIVRRALATLSIVLVLALAGGCGRATMATGAALTFTGTVGVAGGVALGGGGCEGPCFGGDPAAFGIVMGGKAILVGLGLILVGRAIAAEEDRQDEEAAAKRRELEVLQPAPPAPPPPPPPQPPPGSETGVWREVPFVPGDE